MIVDVPKFMCTKCNYVIAAEQIKCPNCEKEDPRCLENVTAMTPKEEKKCKLNWSTISDGTPFCTDCGRTLSKKEASRIPKYEVSCPTCHSGALDDEGANQ